MTDETLKHAEELVRIHEEFVEFGGYIRHQKRREHSDRHAADIARLALEMSSVVNTLREHATKTRAAADKRQRDIGTDGLTCQLQSEAALLELLLAGRRDDPSPPAPAWHDAPTGPGLWCYVTTAGDFGFWTVRMSDDQTFPTGRFYGPIPEDQP